MTTVRFHLISTLAPAEVVGVLTDFGPSRAQVWPAIDGEHFVVHGQGEGWAEVTEGTEAAWERARYEWDPAGDTVTVTTLDSELFGAGGGWVFRATPAPEGSRVDVELTRTPRALEDSGRTTRLRPRSPTRIRRDR